ncbi:MAG: restriction endonuclease subunit S, partial [Prevotella sp.]|nr:restriction endonuclease subunit S [Prevotella sp.]
MRKYKHYKDSGIEWIGEIPEHWEIERFKYDFLPSKGLTITKSDLVDNGWPVVNYGQIHSKLNLGTGINGDLIRYVPISYRGLYLKEVAAQNDFIFADTSEDIEGCGNCVFIDKNQEIFAGYHTIIAKSRHKEYGRYFSYLFLTNEWRSQIRSRVYGVKVFSITQNILFNTKVILPSLPEQQSIANYLDKKCGLIDRMIGNLQKKIELLKELKSSVISRAVTKGLDPHVKMKDSGVEWIEEIPEHWEIERFKYDFLPSKGLTITKSDLVDNGWPVVNYGQIHSKLNFGTGINGNLIRYVPISYRGLYLKEVAAQNDFIFADTSEDIEGCGNCVFI